MCKASQAAVNTLLIVNGKTVRSLEQFIRLDCAGRHIQSAGLFQQAGTAKRKRVLLLLPVPGKSLQAVQLQAVGFRHVCGSLAIVAATEPAGFKGGQSFGRLTSLTVPGTNNMVHQVVFIFSQQAGRGKLAFEPVHDTGQVIINDMCRAAHGATRLAVPQGQQDLAMV